MSPRNRSLVVLAVLAIVFLGSLTLLGPRLVLAATDSPITNPTDFRAFYCGGAVVGMRADPYRVQPLMACEQHALATFKLTMLPNFVLPAPLPPYALFGFAAIARLPFPIASIAWCILSVVLLALTIGILARLTGLPILVVGLVLVAADGYASLVIGQIVPLVVFALVAAARCMRDERYVAASIFLGSAMIEPHVAMPALAASVFFVPRMRIPLAVVIGALVLISFVAVSPAVVFEYVARVLPAHARSEVGGFGAQYSLTSLLFALGVGADGAVRAGEISYVLTTFVGLYCTKRMSQDHGDVAYVVLLPAAFATFGGVFIHIHQMAAALPAALLLYAQLGRYGRRSAVLAMAVVLLAIPWESIAETPTIMNAYARGRVATHRDLPMVRAEALAEEPEIAYIDAGGSYVDGRSVAEMILWKAPTWIALVIVLGTALRLSRRHGVIAIVT